jgi:Tol biopolymer transport system component
VLVMDANTRLIRVVADALRGAPTVSWLPDGRLQIVKDTTRLNDLEMEKDIEIEGIGHRWSPDGTRVAYQMANSYGGIWIADANGRSPRQIAPGRQFMWSSDSKQLAFLNSSNSELQLADASTGTTKTISRANDLVRRLTNNANVSGWISNLAWSPDSVTLAVSVAWTDGSAIVVLDATSGRLRATWQSAWTRVWFPEWAWSADNRHLAVWVTPDSTPQGELGILDIQTNEQTDLTGRAFDWSPDGKWLAVTQDPSGLLIATPDLSVMHWLNTPNCFDVTWRPKG